MNPIERVADWMDDPPLSEPAFGPAAPHAPSGDFDVDAFIQRHGLKVRRRGEWRGGRNGNWNSAQLIPSTRAGAR